MGWFVYMIRASDGSLYTGVTTDVKRRFEEHCSAGKRAALRVNGQSFSGAGNRWKWCIPKTTLTAAALSGGSRPSRNFQGIKNWN